MRAQASKPLHVFFQGHTRKNALTLDHARWILEPLNRLLRGVGRLCAENRKQKTENGKWKTENGKQKRKTEIAIQQVFATGR
jgi:hypothetical protein